MQNIFDIRVQKLFFITLILKVGSSFLGWKFQDPWILGFTVPLLIMGAYIVLGYFRRDADVTDDKFADTCYYLGFIFTITSIIFSLFDLPHIGTKIQDIAVRFGAAMVSTVLGLAVRVYLVSFKKDVADAINDAEDAVLDATRKFTEQLNVAVERLRDFEAQVDTAAKTSVERVNLQMENLSKSHADKLTLFFADLANKNQEAFTSALGEVKLASQRLAASVDGYSLGMRANLGSIEAKVGAFADAVTERLKTTTFPDDYFAEHLSTPLVQLKESSAVLAAGIKGALQEVTESTTVLSSALKKLRDKAGAAEGSLEAVLKLTQQQQALLDAAQGQVSSLEQLGRTLKTIDETLASTVASVVSSNGLTSELTSRVGNIVAEGVETRHVLEAALNGVIETLKAQVQATTTVVTSLDAGSSENRKSAQDLAGKLDASIVAAESASTALTAVATVSTVAVDKLEAVAVADLKAVQALDRLGLHATSALSRVDGAVEQLQAMVRQLTALDDTLRARSLEGSLTEAPRIDTMGAVGGLPGGPLSISTPLGLHVGQFGSPDATLLRHQPEALLGLGGTSTAPTWRQSKSSGVEPSGSENSEMGAPAPGNGAAFNGAATGRPLGNRAPLAPQIQVPPPSHQTTEGVVGSPPSAPLQPPTP